MSRFTITHDVDGTLQSVVMSASDKEGAQEEFARCFEANEWPHGNIVSITQHKTLRAACEAAIPGTWDY